MASFNREQLDQVALTCQSRLPELAQVLGAMFGLELQVQVAESEAAEAAPIAAEYSQPGMVIALRLEAEAVLVLVPDPQGVIPVRHRQVRPDSAGELQSLPEQIARLVLPESVSFVGGELAYFPNLGEALERAGLPPDAARVHLNWSSSDQAGKAAIVWPATQPEAIWQRTADQSAEPSGVGSATSPPPQKKAAEPNPPRAQYEDIEDGLEKLPCYARSLLKIKVPVMVTLAESRQPVENVLNIGPGSIIHFNKPCEDTLTLEVAGEKIAVGEAVKVGDKFGLWITSMILPEERFWVLSGRSVAERAK